MTNRNFDEWIEKFRPSISSYDYYIDFAKVVKNVNEITCSTTFRNVIIINEILYASGGELCATNR